MENKATTNRRRQAWLLAGLAGWAVFGLILANYYWLYQWRLRVSPPLSEGLLSEEQVVTLLFTQFFWHLFFVIDFGSWIFTYPHERIWGIGGLMMMSLTILQIFIAPSVGDNLVIRPPISATALAAAYAVWVLMVGIHMIFGPFPKSKDPTRPETRPDPKKRKGL